VHHNVEVVVIAGSPRHEIRKLLEITNRIVPGSYRPNPKHYILTEDGFFQLGPDLEECLLEVLAATPDPEDEPESLGLPN